MRQSRRPAALLAIIASAAAIALPAGCAKPTTGANRGQPLSPEAGASEGVFAPRTIRIHPTTRVTQGSAGRPAVDVYFELFDHWNHGTKGLGELVIELYEVGGLGGDSQIQVWQIDLRDPDKNAEPYDRVTRSYHLTLTDVPTELPSDRQLEVRVRFTTVGGRELSARYPMSF